ncbi:MAG TPA: DUF4440 domain-containing protein [Candidatus Binatia bacterium]|jgi:ketosteroid isomerase-like protein|nr:DUF4440 domain-containing protein [Candidatus Binatia bacterium]
MNKEFSFRAMVWCVVWLIACGTPAPSVSPEASAPIEIRTALEKWPRDFNAKDAPWVCGLFALDLVASYPGQPDKNYEAMCQQLTAAVENLAKTFRYDAPQIEEILVSGDLAVVRLVWTLTITDPNMPGGLIVKERGIDVFKRQKEGTWKISISHAYPDPPTDRDK